MSSDKETWSASPSDLCQVLKKSPYKATLQRIPASKRKDYVHLLESGDLDGVDEDLAKLKKHKVEGLGTPVCIVEIDIIRLLPLAPATSHPGLFCGCSSRDMNKGVAKVFMLRWDDHVNYVGYMLLGHERCTYHEELGHDVDLGLVTTLSSRRKSEISGATTNVEGIWEAFWSGVQTVQSVRVAFNRERRVARGQDLELTWNEGWRVRSKTRHSVGEVERQLVSIWGTRVPATLHCTIDPGDLAQR